MNIVASVKLTPTEIKKKSEKKSVCWIFINNLYFARLANEYFNGMVLLKRHLSTKQYIVCVTYTRWRTAWLLFSKNCLIYNSEVDDGVERRIKKKNDDVSRQQMNTFRRLNESKLSRRRRTKSNAKEKTLEWFEWTAAWFMYTNADMVMTLVSQSKSYVNRMCFFWC